LEINEEQGKKLKTMWVDKSLPEVIDLGSSTFRKNELKTIILASENKENITVAKMTTQEIKDELGDFLAEFDNHFIGKKLEYKGFMPIAARDEGIIKWAQELGAIYYHEKPYPYWAVKDPEFADLNRKLELRNELNYRREYMYKQEQKNIDSLAEEWKYEKDDSIPDQITEEQFNELKAKRDNLIGIVTQRTKELKDEINIDEIPFGDN
ncbi:MAG: hypothetical protein AABY22_34695, partial [Nanoarchaeota archaeon]